jgi:glycosyltransferase involved in cell wall biosynthesis
MVKNHKKTSGPLVSVLIPTYNRRRFLPVALSSVVRQDYDNLEIFVIRDGGEEVSDVVNSFDDSRIIFINNRENRGVALARNEALRNATGKYICYLDDDDLYYPHHVSTLVNALENQTDCEVAYSDLYQTYCRIGPDGKREALSKVVEVSRDFDRFVMLFYNHVLQVSLMHRRDLVEKIGLYNENLNVLLDWDLTRRLVFFSDFYHIHEITGEFYCPVGQSDRISVQRRKNKDEYLKNIITIRTTRPAKPWPKIKDMSIIFVSSQLNQRARETLGSIWRHTFYPYELYLPLSRADLNRLQTDMPNIITIPVETLMPETEQVDMALAKCDGEYVTIVPSGFPISEFWVEDSLYALLKSTAEREAFELEGSTDKLQAIVSKKDDLLYARKSFPNLSVYESLKAAGVVTRRLRPDEIPFQFDQLLQEAKSEQKQENWAQAAEIFEYIADRYQNRLWMKSLAANAFYKAGNLTRATQLCSDINRQRPTVDMLLLEARLKRQEKDFHSAIEMLESSEQILEGKELLWT